MLHKREISPGDFERYRQVTPVIAELVQGLGVNC